ncbi:MAG: DNA polymerase III subunit beta [Cyanobacteria bacterium REEB459]|nr:DNA polymerase III subunit beta [Cyanobacteria bacterium REEB459]
MKFVCTQNALNNQLSLVSRAVPARPNRPVLGNVLVTADSPSQTVTLVGFDEVLGIQTRFSAQVSEGGELTLPAKLLSDIVALITDETITLESDPDHTAVTLTSLTGHYQVRGLGAEDYPALPTVDQGESLALSAESLLNGLKGSLFATSGDETKQVLTGVHLLTSADGLEFAATDGHRLAVVKTGDDLQVPQPIDLTLPSKALRELERMVQGYNSTEPVQVSLDEVQVLFDLGHQRLTTRLLEGQYPNYRQLLPKQFSHQVTFNRRDLIASLGRIAVLATQKNNIIKVSLNQAQQQVSLTVEAQELGSGQEDLPAQITGEDLDIAFNVTYLLDGLKSFDTQAVQMQCNSSTSPAVLTPLGEKQITYLVMPVQIRT